MTATAAATALTMTKFIKAPRQKVYEAWTRPELLKQWMGPQGTVVRSATADGKVGGSYRVVMESTGEGMGAAGSQWIVAGKYQELVPGEKVVLSWKWENGDATDTLITVTLKEKDGGTEMTLLHERFANGDQVKSHEHGWTGSFEKMATLLQ
ncbi:MAG TPA: SRPBCC domain-containing protein [Gemmatimonadales bacterium]|nr:SRPBCC domain-containing protein [Gemmatimonadales bacterium]